MKAAPGRRKATRHGVDGRGLPECGQAGISSLAGEAGSSAGAAGGSALSRVNQKRRSSLPSGGAMTLRGKGKAAWSLPRQKRTTKTPPWWAAG